LTTAKGYGTGLTDQTTYGYAAGGNSGAYMTSTDRIVFSSGVMSSATVSALEMARGQYSVVAENGSC
jgi:hypothetical protein